MTASDVDIYKLHLPHCDDEKALSSAYVIAAERFCGLCNGTLAYMQWRAQVYRRVQCHPQCRAYLEPVNVN